MAKYRDALRRRLTGTMIFSSAGVRCGFVRAQGLAVGVFGYALAFGLLASDAGLSVLEAVLMSATVYSGSAQVATVGGLATGAGVLASVVTVLMLNARYLLYGASLRPWLGAATPGQAYASLYLLGDGIYFGGQREQWANYAFREALAKHVAHAKHAAIIDFHTGIGPWMEHIYLCFHKEGSPARERARSWWGERAVNLAGVTHKALADYQGVLIDAFAAALPRAQVTSIVVEFGTLKREEVQRANMAGRWLRYHGAQNPALARKVHAEFCEAFYPSDSQWRAAALEQSREILDRGIKGIGA